MPQRSAISIMLFAAFLVGCDRKPAQPPFTPTPAPTSTPTPAPTPTPTPAPPTPTPTPTPYVPQKVLQTGQIFNGVSFKTNFETIPGGTATAERDTSDSYTVEVNVKIKVPKPHQKIEELKKLNANLDKLLPSLTELLEKAKVSPEFDELYRNKTNSVRNNINRLDQVLSRHNFYDCETILQLQHPTSKRKALLLQSDMDVDTDGSDGDRVVATEGSVSRTYQPFTSYRWPKKTQVPNSCIAMWEKKITDAEAKARTTPADAPRLRENISEWRREIRDMQTFSYLMGVADPFIVLPTTMFGRNRDGFTPTMGDYCVVIVGDVLYPAIVGDAGPIAKMGEGSLRLCRQVNARANAEFRPVSDLKATYLVFPGSSEKPWGPPDLAQWKTRCEALLAEFGGYTGTLFTWEDITKSTAPPPPPPPPPPVPVVPPTPAPATQTPAAQPPTTPPTAPATPASPPAPGTGQ